MSQRMSRREFIKFLTTTTGGIVLVSCGQQATPNATTPDTITVVETKEVEVVREVTSTPPPVVQEAVADVLGTFPRRETLIVRQLTGRVGTPDNMNLWVGWKWQDRGLQNLADEALWSVDFATGEIVSGLADGDPRPGRR